MLDQSYSLRTPSIVSDEVGGETLAINLDTGAYYVIAPTALTVWHAITAGIAPRALLDGPDDDREPLLLEFLSRVVEAGLLRIVESGAVPDGPIDWRADGLALEEFTDMADLLGLDPIHDADEVVGWPSTDRPG